MEFNSLCREPQEYSVGLRYRGASFSSWVCCWCPGDVKSHRLRLVSPCHTHERGTEMPSEIRPLNGQLETSGAVKSSSLGSVRCLPYERIKSPCSEKVLWGTAQVSLLWLRLPANQLCAQKAVKTLTHQEKQSNKIHNRGQSSYNESRLKSALSFSSHPSN